MTEESSHKKKGGGGKKKKRGARLHSERHCSGGHSLKKAPSGHVQVTILKGGVNLGMGGTEKWERSKGAQKAARACRQGGERVIVPERRKNTAVKNSKSGESFWRETRSNEKT